ncbi:MAG: hypothetical protein Q9184_001123 [Pyrenodesmia sp. 2 TL-2023]
MAYFLPSYFQKRILRYALSKLDLLDAEQLNLDNLDVAWGKRSVVELRDVGVQLTKLASLIQLPPHLVLIKASIKLLRVTIPADLYNSGILAEVDGIEIQLDADTQPKEDHGDTEPKAKKAGLESHRRGTSADRPRSLRPKVHDPGGGSKTGLHNTKDEDGSSDSAALPTADDLAKSYLQAEPRKEKVELQAAVAQSQQMDESNIVDDSDRSAAVGVGNELSLPAFLSGFLKGIVDRFRLELRDVRVDLVLRIDMPSDNTLVTAASDRSENVTLRLSINDIDYMIVSDPDSRTDKGVGSLVASALPQSSSSIGGTRRQVRQIRISKTKGVVLSDASIFSSLLPSLAPSTSSENTVAGSPSGARRQTPSADDVRVDAPRNVNERRGMSRLPQASPAETSPGVSMTGLSQRTHSRKDPGLSRGLDVNSTGAERRPPPTLQRGNLERRTGSDGFYSCDRSSASVFESTHNLQILPQRHVTKPTTASTRSLRYPDDDVYAYMPSRTKIDPERQGSHPNEEQRGSGISTKSSSPDLQQGSSPAAEDLAESKIFSHEEAESMYMSAMSSIDPAELGVEKTIPGAWESHAEDDPTAKDASLASFTEVKSRLSSETKSREPDLAESENDERSIGPSSLSSSTTSDDIANAKDINVTQPHEASLTAMGNTLPLSPSISDSSDAGSEGSLIVSKPFLIIDQVYVEIPYNSTLSATSSPPTAGGDAKLPGLTKSPRVQFGRAAASDRIEGPIFDSVDEGSSYAASSSGLDAAGSNIEAATTIRFGLVDFKTDMGLARLTALIIRRLSRMLPSETLTKETDKSASAGLHYETRITVDRIAWHFYDRVVGSPIPKDVSSSARLGTEEDCMGCELLLKATVQGFESVSQTNSGTHKSKVSVARVSFGYASGNIVSFDTKLKMRESTRDTFAPANKDLVLTIAKDTRASKIELTTLPIHVRLDLRRLDEMFAWLGGFSSILDLGNSMISTVTTLDPARSRKIPAHKAGRGVHFESPGAGFPANGNAASDPMLRKVTARIGGLTCELLGSESSLRLEGSALKVVSRIEGLGVQVDRLYLSGLYLKNPMHQPAVVCQFFNVRLEYLPEPKEVDLTRLLELLSPSRDKYEIDDDILLDTLLRQRRQGGVIRLTAERSENRISHLNDVRHFSTLAEELKKLGTVTKYLPEDDRPGILILTLIRQLRCDAQIGGALGLIEAEFKDIEFADVTLPSLFALGISSIYLRRNGDEELVTNATPIERQGENRSPMIMARFVGNEMEPTVKLKLYGICVEYQVPFILAIMDWTGSTQSEELLADMAGSIAALTERQRSKDEEGPGSGSPHGISGLSGKSIPGYTAPKIDVTVRHSLIGLNPRKSSAKGLVVLTETHFAGTVPQEQEANATLEIQKAALMIIDDHRNIMRPGTYADQVLVQPEIPQLQVLEAMGYVSVSSISAARALFHVIQDPQTSSQSIDVEIRDNLFVLESCADSTQTLQAILNGLPPPLPPNKDERYRTEVVLIEDMLSSLPGMAYTLNGARVESNEPPPRDNEEDLENEDLQDPEMGASFYDLESSRQFNGISDSMLDEESDSIMVDTSAQAFDESPSLSDSYSQSQEEEAEGPPLEFQDDHFGPRSSVGGTAHRWNTKQNTYGLSNEATIRRSPLRVRVRDVHVIWNLFDGYDWQLTRDTISKAITDVEIKALNQQTKREKRKPQDQDDEEESVIGDFLFNSIYIGIPANKDPRHLSRQISRNLDDIASEPDSSAPSTLSSSPSRPSAASPARIKRPRLSRSKHHKMTFELKGVSADLVVFPPASGETQSSMDVRVHDLEVFDHVPTSTWKKFATYMQDAGERESGTSMIHLEILNVRPMPELAASEMILKATILPLRLHVDQDALDFMTRFFEFKDDTAREATTKPEAAFFQRVEVNPVRLRLDFKPKRVDYAAIRSGHTNEFMNFFILDRADMVLRHVIIYGISGFDRLGKTLNDIWMPDIKRNQLPGILAGLAPVRSLVNVGGGVRDLVVIPIEEYQKDGRIVRSLQKGALAFAKTTTSELVKLGAKLAIGTQTVLQGAEDLFTQPEAQRADVAGGWEEAGLDKDEKKHISLYADQPVGVIQGLRGAYASLERDLLTAKDAIVAIPGEVMESGTAGGAARAVLKGAPTVILRPALGVTKAVSRTLMGATNSLDPENRRRIDEVSHSPRDTEVQRLTDLCNSQKYKKH